MAKKIGYILLTWFLVIFVYIILAASMPGIRSLTTETETTLQSSVNMTHFPGILEVVQTAPLWIWFIPGAVGLIATGVFLKQAD